MVGQPSTSMSSTSEICLNDSYERRYRLLVRSIAQDHPQTVIKLLSIEQEFGLQAAHQAAVLIVCLEAHVEVAGVGAAEILNDDDLKKFAFFEYMKDSLHALELLVDLLECHVEECQGAYPKAAQVESVQ